MNKNEIDIEDFKKFVANHQEIEHMLDRSSYDLSDIVVDSNYYAETQETVNSLLDSLQKEPVSSRLSCGPTLKSKIDSLVTLFNNSAVSLIAALELAEKEIVAYSKGESLGELSMSMLNQVMKGAADLNVFWLVRELTSRNPVLSSFGFLLAYGTDQKYEDSNFVVGDGTKLMAEELWPALLEESKKRPIKHAMVGAGAVMILTGFQDVLFDEGNFDSVLDYARTGIDVAGSGLNYANWVLVSSAVGGIPGILLAAASTMTVAPMVDQFKDKAVGDNIIHTIEKGDKYDKDYEVPKNGNGVDRAYDVLFERYKEANDTSYTLNNQTYTNYNYKSILYRDWETLLPGGRGLYGDEAAEQFNSYLEEIKNSNDPAIVQQYEERLDLANPQSLGDNTAKLYNILKKDDFDLQEYYDYYHGGLNK